MADGKKKKPKPTIRYMVFGCGSIGYNVIEELLKESDNIIVIDSDEKKGRGPQGSEISGNRP